MALRACTGRASSGKATEVDDATDPPRSARATLSPPRGHPGQTGAHGIETPHQQHTGTPTTVAALSADKRHNPSADKHGPNRQRHKHNNRVAHEDLTGTRDKLGVECCTCDTYRTLRSPHPRARCELGAESRYPFRASLSHNSNGERTHPEAARSGDPGRDGLLMVQAHAHSKRSAT